MSQYSVSSIEKEALTLLEEKLKSLLILSKQTFSHETKSAVDLRRTLPLVHIQYDPKVVLFN